MSIISLLPSTEERANQMPVLRLGSQGDVVIILQQCLYRAGHYDGSIDGIFNLKTYDATRAFQRQVGIFPRGIVDRRTWIAIMGYYSGLGLQD